jgi:hypothetical protein
MRLNDEPYKCNLYCNSHQMALIVNLTLKPKGGDIKKGG